MTFSKTPSHEEAPAPRQREFGDARLRLIELKAGDIWPERRSCELVLIVECQADGFRLAGLDAPLGVGDAALLPAGNGLDTSANGRALSARLDGVAVLDRPERVRDDLIAELIRRVWSSSSAAEIIDPALRLIEVFVATDNGEQQVPPDILALLDPRIARVLDYIEENYGKKLTTAELAAVACLSRGHFSRAFKEAMSESVWTYVQRRRCECARDLVRTTRLSLSEIAYRCGFASQSHMTTAFRNIFGTTPGGARAARRG